MCVRRRPAPYTLSISKLLMIIALFSIHLIIMIKFSIQVFTRWLPCFPCGAAGGPARGRKGARARARRSSAGAVARAAAGAQPPRAPPPVRSATSSDSHLFK